MLSVSQFIIMQVKEGCCRTLLIRSIDYLVYNNYIKILIIAVGVSVEAY